MSARMVLIVGVVGVLAAGIFAASRPIGNGYIFAVSGSDETVPWDEQRLFFLGPGVSRIPMELQASMRPGDELVYLGSHKTSLGDFFDDVDVWLGQEVAPPLYLVSSGKYYQRFRSPAGEEWREVNHFKEVELFQVQTEGRKALEKAPGEMVEEASR